MRKDGKITKEGTTEITMEDWRGKIDRWDYVGEVNEYGQACGEGVASKGQFSKNRYHGQFLNNTFEGIGVYTDEKGTW